MALSAEVESAPVLLGTPAARSIARGEERLLKLDDVEVLFASKTLVVDACRYVVRDSGTVVPLARRSVLFALLYALAEAWPQDVLRDTLVEKAFGAKRADESYRARLRVEMGRLRKELRPIADITATQGGFVLMPHRATEVVMLTQPVDAKHADVLALLADGEWWSSSALALTLGVSQRTMQRAMEALATSGSAQSFGRGRTRRWTASAVPGFATTLLLPGLLPSD
jgi:hypothetical protein